MSKTVIISGGTSGIGKGFVLTLLEEGFNVATFSRSRERCIALRKELEKKYRNFIVKNADVTDEGDMEKLAEETANKFSSIDILINNAGYGYFVKAEDVDIQKFKDVMETNVIGMGILTKQVIPYMKRKKSGLIINIASISGKMSFHGSGYYSATKHAVMGLSKGLRLDLKDSGIKVCTICPGMIDTQFFSEEEIERRKKLGRKMDMLHVDDVSRVVKLICTQSEASDIQDITIMPF